jgi:titin
LDPDGSVVSWSWSFGDGSTGTGASVNHLWSAPGSYNVTLTVTDNSGATSGDSATVVVTNRAPTANAGADQSGTTGSSLSFSGSGSNDMDGSIATYSWTFGDGASATGMNVTHAFATGGSYTVTLTTTDNLGAQDTDVAMANVAASVTIPNPPSALNATAASSSRIDLTWSDNSSNETGFKIERASSSTGPFTQIGTSTLASFSDMSAPTASTSFYRVSAYNTAGTSAPSNVDSATTSDNVPASPSALGATAISSSRIDLNWTDNSSNESGFKVERSSSSTGPFTQIGTSTAASFSDTSAPTASTSFYRVSAYNTAGTSAPSNTANATTPDVPPAAASGLGATAVSSSRIDLNWTDNSSNESGFKIERSSSSTGPFTQIGTSTTPTFSDMSAPVASTSFYRVIAYNTAGSAAASNVASATTSDNVPASPSALGATAISSSRIDLNWTDNSSNESGFKVERSSSSTGPFTQIGTSTAASFSDTSAPTASTSFYRVSAYNTAGTSAPSNTANATTPDVPPAAPASCSAAPASQTQINLQWSDSSSNETSFKIERSSAASGPWTLVTTMGANTTSWANTGLAAGTTWWYRVKASNAAGDSAPSPLASATTQASAPVLPAPPSNLTATATSTSAISLSWLDNSTNETGFKIERATSVTGTFTQVAAPGAGATSWGDSGLTSNTTYYYRVRATSGAGDSTNSNTANATTQGGSSDVTPPSVPSGVVTTAPTCGGVLVTWNASTDAGGSGLRGYNVYRKNETTPFVQVPNSETRLMDSGLSSATFYYYTIEAVDNAGNKSAKTSPVGVYSQSCAGSGGTYDWATHSGGSIAPDEGYGHCRRLRRQ